MSCRHDLALGTCRVCYPATGTIEPLEEGGSPDGPGAAPAKNLGPLTDPKCLGPVWMADDRAAVAVETVADEVRRLRAQVEQLSVALAEARRAAIAEAKARIEALDSPSGHSLYVHRLSVERVLDLMSKESS